jgi:hypothetical protein
MLVTAVSGYGSVFYIKYCIFLYESYVNCGSCGKCWEKLSHKQPRVIVANTREIFKLMDKVRCIASVLGKKPFKKYDLLAEQRVDEIGTVLEYSPRQSPRHRPQETGISK